MIMQRTLALATSLSIAGSALADTPVLGGTMLHLLVSQNGQALEFQFETPVTEPVELLFHEGDVYSGPASVLTGTHYSGRFGWLADGFFDLPAGSGVFVENLGTSPGLSVYDAFSFAPILGTSGSSNIWQWGGMMTHNWYSATGPGVYSAAYRVYVGNASTREPIAGWTPVELTLEWFVPSVCVADVNNDGVLSPADFTAWIASYNAQSAGCDQNGDGFCTPADFTAWISNYNAGCG